MSILDNLTAAPKGERTLATVKAYAVTVQPHTNKAGVLSHGLKIYPVLSDGSAGRFGDMWVRLSEGPESLRALRDSLPRIAAAIEALDAKMVAAGEWKAEPKAAAPAPAPKAKAAPTPPPAPPARKSVLDDLLGDLPA